MRGARRARLAAGIVVAVVLASGCAPMKDTMREIGDNFRSIGSGGSSAKEGSPQPGAAGATDPAARAGSGGATASKQGDGTRVARTRVLRISGATIQPERVKAGAEIKVAVNYFAQAPDAGETIDIAETRTLIIDGETIKLGESRIALRTQGRQTATVRITLPEHIPSGTYTVVVALSDGHLTRTVRRTFRVVP